MTLARRIAPLAVLGALCTSATAAPEEPTAPGPARPAYPETRRTDVRDVLHGQEVPDPYRWLADDEAPEVEAWDRAQAALLRARLDAFPRRAELKERLERELDLGGMESLPTFAGGWAFHTFRAPGQNHEALYRRPADRDEAPQVVLDPNTWSADGTEGLGDWWPSPDGRWLAYGRDSKGSEDLTLYVRDLESGKDLPERITRTKFTSVAWRPDSKAFLYSRLPDPDDVPEAERQYHRRVRLHVLGSAVQDDPVVYGQGRPMIESSWVGTSTDEQHLFVVRGIPYEGLDTFEVDLAGGAPRLEPVLVGNDSRTYVDRVGDLYVLNTDWQAPRRRICTAPRGQAQDPKDWRTIVPEGEAVIEQAVLARDRLAVLKREDLASRIVVVGLDGSPLGEVDLPGAGSVREVKVRPGDTRLWFSFEAYHVPLGTWVVDLARPARGAGATARYEPTLRSMLPTTLRVDELTSERMDLPSKDGTRIPVMVLRRKDRPLDGSAPTILYGYGGFRVGVVPAFSRSMALWAELGGVYAVASLRGGDEFGEAWHEAGSLARKQNVFDDFIAVADGLVAAGKARRERLAIMGGSNGGLLVAACANQRPDLCRAVVCSVPLTDMLRFHRFQYAKAWTKEYGDPDVAEQFAWIRPYSPYHNVREGAAYPAALVTAGLADGRVNAFHARKIVAQWQRASSSPHPILLFLDRESGHGASSMKQAKAEVLDRFCFLLGELGG
ncbi:MAG: prolyl oligopeptidase family serine peptidase [Planctomycetia bacterium]